MTIVVLLFMLCLSVSANGRTWHNFNGSQYSIEMTPVNSYAEAERGCSALQANVANVQTTDIFNYLKSFINLTDTPFSLYIGAKRVANTDQFRWNDRSDVSPTTTMWKRGQPNNNNGNDNCVTMGYKFHSVQTSSYRWYDVPCTNHNARYICEKRMSATSTLPSTQPSTKPTTSIILTASNVKSTTKSSLANNTTQAPPKPNTAIIASAIGGCVILVIICIIVIFFVASRIQRRRNKPANAAAVIEYNAGGDEFELEETYNIPQIEENSFANHSTQPYLRHQNDDVNHYHAILEPRHENVIVDEVAQIAAGSSDVYAQITKSKQSTKVHDNGQQSHVRKYDHNQLDEFSYDTLQLSQHVEVHDQFASGSNPTNIYDNRHGANDESVSAYDELRRHK